MPEMTVKHVGDMKFETQMGNHKLIIDVPPEMNGKDRGPTPPQLFIASLSSCIAVFATSYCKNTGINAEGLSVTLSFDKLKEPTRLGNFKAAIKIPKGEVGKRDKAVIHAASHCPIHETIRLSQEVEITLER
jgi:putative redox protein